MNAAKITLVSTILAAALGLVLGLLAAPAQANHDCTPGTKFEDHPHCGAGPSGSNPVSLAITYEFGDFDPDEAPLSEDACVEPDCATTTIIVDGTLTCGQNGCEFVGEVNTDFFLTDFFLPEGLHTLLDEVAWRGVELDPTACYGYDPVFESLGTLLATHVLLGSGVGDGSPAWRAHVSGTADDDLGFVDRSYKFHFFGGCDEGCPDLQDLEPGVPVTFDISAMGPIFSPSPKKKEEKALPEGEAFGTACRCTMSSTPDCPDDVVDGFGVSIPSPPIRVTVTDVTP